MVLLKLMFLAVKVLEEDGIDDDCVSYLWTADLDGDGIEEFTSSELNINNLCAGSYTLLATDCNGCVNTFTYDITQPEELSATFDVVEHVLMTRMVQ